MSEFSLINCYFSAIGKRKEDVVLGIGDDAAIVNVENKKRLVVSVDTFIEGVHFPAATAAYNVGWKSLAVNLSDMAAMGATPLWVTLAITLPEKNASWLAEFSRGFNELATCYDVALIGGDTTRGPLSVTVNIIGEVECETQLLRSNASPGDKIYVSGFLGDAALGLKSLTEQLPISDSEKLYLQHELNRPLPRLKEALALKSTISAAIDISDGLDADLKHILNTSDVGAKISVQQLPVSREYRWCCNGPQSFDVALTGGDDYELCVTVSADNEAMFLKLAAETELRWSCIGEITEGETLSYVNSNDEIYTVNKQAYDHFQVDS